VTLPFHFIRMNRMGSKNITEIDKRTFLIDFELFGNPFILKPIQFSSNLLSENLVANRKVTSVYFVEMNL
jgi:hypothetical protein